MTSRALPPSNWPCEGAHECGIGHPRWKCTREKGHDGNHEAGGISGQKFAEWPADQPDGGA